MKFVAGFVLGAACTVAGANNEAEIQRALIQRDQQSAEFAARVRGADTSSLQQLHARQLLDAGRPLHVEPEIARQLHSYQRHKMADERALVLPPPAMMIKPSEKPASGPLPLPGGPKHGVDPLPVQGWGN